MKSPRPKLCGFLLVSLLSLPVFAQETPKPKPPPDAAALAALMQPGPEHALLAKYVGQWDLEVSSPTPPGRPPVVWKGSAVNVMEIGGRFLRTKFNYEGAGMKQEGDYTLGFDRRHNKFVFVGMDSWGTYYVTAMSQKDSPKETIKLYGQDDDPQMAAMGYKKEFGFVYEWAGDDKFTLRILFMDTRTPERREIEYLKFTFTRKK